LKELLDYQQRIIDKLEEDISTTEEELQDLAQLFG
jgi:hypothetical protein